MLGEIEEPTRGTIPMSCLPFRHFSSLLPSCLFCLVFQPPAVPLFGGPAGASLREVLSYVLPPRKTAEDRGKSTQALEPDKMLSLSAPGRSFVALDKLTLSSSLKWGI